MGGRVSRAGGVLGVYEYGHVCHGMSAEVRGQLGSRFPPSTMWLPGVGQMVRLGGSHLYMLSLLTGPQPDRRKQITKIKCPRSESPEKVKESVLGLSEGRRL